MFTEDNNNFIKQDKQIKNDPLNKTFKKSAKIGSLKSIWWILILILSIIFGSYSIFLFSESLGNFIESIKIEDISDSIKNFFISFTLFWEPLLFIFFIFYSIKKIFYNMKIYLKWWKLIEPERIEKKLKDLKKIEEIIFENLINLGIKHQVISINTSNKKKELKIRKKDLKKAKNKLKKYRKKQNKNKMKP